MRHGEPLGNSLACCGKQLCLKICISLPSGRDHLIPGDFHPFILLSTAHHFTSQLFFPPSLCHFHLPVDSPDTWQCAGPIAMLTWFKKLMEWTKDLTSHFALFSLFSLLLPPLFFFLLFLCFALFFPVASSHPAPAMQNGSLHAWPRFWSHSEKAGAEVEGAESEVCGYGSEWAHIHHQKV